jgi:hypothetical protein
MKKALGLSGLKSSDAGQANAPSTNPKGQWDFAIKGVQFANELKKQKAQDTWAVLINKTKKTIKEIKER